AIGGDALSRALDEIHAAGKQAALSLKPATPVEAVYPWLGKLDMVLVMTVEPGFGGQAFMTEMLPKTTALREEITRRGAHRDAHDMIIQVDGGISESTIGQAAKAGANCFVAGSAIFQAEDVQEAIARLRELTMNNEQ
ncbi:MAG: hypothetical protein FWF60_09620, partial [Oscillospiraceae bacterium]|nr:hypothetical protein [Oscillospiraceae bacterium]